VGGAEAFLLDFDGPVCDLFPAGSGSIIGDRARTPIRAAGVVLPEPIASTVEHLKILRYVATHFPDVLEDVEQAAVQGEIEAVRNAPITPGAAEFLAACGRTGRPVVIVSNNAAAAVELFLDRYDLKGVAAILGRPYARPDLMKPSPHNATQALQLLGRSPAACCMIGDEPTDIQFAHAAGLTSIAYAKSARHEDRLRAAGPQALTHAMRAITDCL
jgi:phosphoglycolate phosphatase